LVGITIQLKIHQSQRNIYTLPDEDLVMRSKRQNKV